METNAISKFNRALRDSVKKKWADLKDNNPKIFRFDLDKVLAEPLELEDLDKNLPNDGLEYFWIEYEKGGSRMKFAFFFKDFDNSKPTYNVHVIPGIFEEYSFQPGKKPPQNKPYACVEDGNAVIKNIKRGYPLFSEQDGGGWWCPKEDCDCIPLKRNEKNGKNELVDTNRIETIPGFDKYFEEFRIFEKTASSNFADYLNSSIEGLKIGGQKTPTERYKLLGWHNIKGANYSMHLTKPIFFMGYGFFTQYHCINFGKDIGGWKKKGENDIITYYPVVKTVSDYQKYKGISLPDGSIFSIGADKVIALRGNHEDMAIEGSWRISEHKCERSHEIDYDEDDRDDEYISWMEDLPVYYVEGNTIFCHAGIDEDAEDMWEYNTDEYTFTGKYPAQTGKFRCGGADMKIVAGHVYTSEIADNPRFHEIYFDGESHYYIDGEVLESGEIPVLAVDTEADKYYSVTDSGMWLVEPYNEDW